MKHPNRGEDPWAWWQPLKLRMEIRKHMKPITPDQANSRRLVVASLYLACAAAFFHLFAFRAGIANHKPTGEGDAIFLVLLSNIFAVEPTRALLCKNTFNVPSIPKNRVISALILFCS